MPRFFFHTLDHVDRIGTVLPNVASARKKGLSLVAGLVRDACFQNSLSGDWHVRITDDVGLTLFHMDFVVVATAATG